MRKGLGKGRCVGVGATRAASRGIGDGPIGAPGDDREAGPGKPTGAVASSLEVVAGEGSERRPEGRLQDHGRRWVVVAEDLRRRLTVITAMTELLRATSMDARQRRYVDNIEAAAERLLGTARGMAELGRIEMGTARLAGEAFDLRELVEETVGALAGAASARGLELICAMAPETPRGVYGDTAHLRQALYSLIESAIETTNGSQIEVRVGMPAARNGVWRFRFEVEDSLPGSMAGIPGPGPDTPTDEPGQEGTVASIMAQAWAQAMDGEAGLNGVGGGGSLGWLVVPLAQGRATDLAERVPVDDLRGVPVTVVDGNRERRHVLRLYLAGLGLDPRCYGTVDAALTAMAGADRGPRLLIVDEHLGANELARLRAQCRTPAGDSAPLLVLVTAGAAREADAPLSGGQAEWRLAKPVMLIPLGLTIARALGARPPEPEVAALEMAVPGDGPRILLAEDNPVNQQVAVEMLAELGCTVVVAKDGREVLAAVEREPFDLILMDCLMPHLDGFDAAREIRRREAERGVPRCPIVAVTALSMEDDRARCRAAGMDDFLGKPFRRKEMQQALERWRVWLQNGPGTDVRDRSAGRE